MIPLQDLLNRIRWDRDFGRGRFDLGYYDRMAERIIIVPLQQVTLSEGDHFAFQLVGPEGETLSIPFHRVRQVYKDGQLIWSREKKG
jgi:uncharacterized protein (UPF0248 family)